MIKLSPAGVHSSTDSFKEKPVVTPPEQVRSESLAKSNSDADVYDFAETDISDKPQAHAQRPAAPIVLPRIDITAPANIHPDHKVIINKVCASVVAELRQTVGWDIDIHQDLRVHSLDRKTLRKLVQRDYHINAFQAWVLTRVAGVIYLPSMKEVVICDEVTRSWHPELLAHEIAKGIVRLSLGLYANRQAAGNDLSVLEFEEKLDQVFSVEHRYRRAVRAAAAFHGAHAESIARKHQPTTHTPPIRQKLWGFLVWFSMYSYQRVCKASKELYQGFEQILNSDLDRVNRIYANRRLTELWHNGEGKVHIYSASSSTIAQLTEDASFLRSLNPNRGSVVAQMNCGSTRAFHP